MKCPNCNSDVSAQAVVCRQCGIVLPGRSYTQTSPAGYYGGAGAYPTSPAQGAYRTNTAPGYYSQTGYAPGGPADPTQFRTVAGPYYPDGYAYRQPRVEKSSAQDSTPFYAKILITLLSLHVALDLLIIIALLLR